MEKYYDEKDENIQQLKEKLKAQHVFGNNPVEEMKSWKAFDDAHPVSEERHLIRSRMKELCLRRVIKSVGCIRDNVQYIQPLIEPRYIEQSTLESDSSRQRPNGA